MKKLRFKLFVVLPLVAFGTVAGCSGKRVSSSVEDQSMQIRQTPPLAVETAPARIPEPAGDASSMPAARPKDEPASPVITQRPSLPVHEPESMPPTVPPEEQISEPPVAPPVAAPVPPPVVADVPVPRRGAEAVPPPASAQPAILGELQDLYFDYDKATIRGDARMVLEQDARVLAHRHAKSLVIEGHCDERGTLDYNLVLGERRARAVQRYLEDLGVRTPMTITSYGKERPQCQDHTEQCWQQNRRAHFVAD